METAGGAMALGTTGTRGGRAGDAAPLVPSAEMLLRHDLRGCVCPPPTLGAVAGFMP